MAYPYLTSSSVEIGAPVSQGPISPNAFPEGETQVSGGRDYAWMGPMVKIRPGFHVEPKSTKPTGNAVQRRKIRFSEVALWTDWRRPKGSKPELEIPGA